MFKSELRSVEFKRCFALFSDATIPVDGNPIEQDDAACYVSITRHIRIRLRNHIDIGSAQQYLRIPQSARGAYRMQLQWLGQAVLDLGAFHAIVYLTTNQSISFTNHSIFFFQFLNFFFQFQFSNRFDLFKNFKFFNFSIFKCIISFSKTWKRSVGMACGLASPHYPAFEPRAGRSFFLFFK